MPVSLAADLATTMRPDAARRKHKRQPERMGSSRECVDFIENRVLNQSEMTV